jgi:beta-lactamase regulating signal transducer with metallopeptidase domain
MSLPSPTPITIAPKQAPPAFNWRAWLLLAWLVGVLISAVRILAAHGRIWQLIRRCPPLPTAFRESLGPEPGRGAVLRLGPTGTTPLVWGGLRPVLLLPADALTWPRERIRAVLLHETAHLDWRDWLTQTLTQIVCALYWFNPLVWLIAWQMQAEAERACDDAVILAGVPAADCAQSLLAVARSLTAARHASAGAVTMARRSPVRERLEAILDTARPRRRVTRRAAALSLLAALALAFPLAALHPAVRADQPRFSRPLPPVGLPTETDSAAVRQHLHALQQEKAGYAAAHPNKQKRVIAKQILKKFGNSALMPLPLTQMTRPKGLPPMTPSKSMKSALLTAAAFTSLAASLTPNAVSASPAAKLIPAPKSTPSAPPTTATDTPHWYKIPLQEIIKTGDAASRQVEVRLALTSVPKTNLNAFGVNFVLVPDSEVQGAPTNAFQYLDGNIAAELLQAFTKQGRTIASPAVTTSSNVEASMSITGGHPTSAQPTLDSLTVTPRINSDDTITVQLHMTISFAGIGKQHQQINTLRTIRSGGTLALCVSPPKPAGGDDHSLLLFITPTIVGTQSSTTVTLH